MNDVKEYNPSECLNQRTEYSLQLEKASAKDFQQILLHK